MSRTRYAQDGKSSPEVFEKRLKEWCDAVEAELTVKDESQMSTAELKQLRALRARHPAPVVVEEVVVSVPVAVPFWRRVWKVVSGY